MIRVFSHGILNIPHLEAFLGVPVASGLQRVSLDSVQAVAGWGLRISAKQAINYARYHELTYLALEDGFLRSLSPGKKEPPLSVVIDDLGIYYDANHSSRLEILIQQALTHEQERRSRRLIDLWCESRVSKYNHQREWKPQNCTHRESQTKSMLAYDRYVLVVDQIMGDASIKYGQANKESFQRMLEAALYENPHLKVVVKIHPDVFTKNKRGYFDFAALSRNPRIRVLSEDIHPAGIIEHAEAVYTVTSQIGFEGLIWGKPVRTFGMPFYAGWGLTLDELPSPARRSFSTLEQLVHAALVTYPRYVNPETGKACEVEEVLSHLALQRQMRGRFPQEIQAYKIPLYKKRSVRRFFFGSNVRFISRVKAVSDKPVVAVWGSDEPVVPELDTPAMPHSADGHMVRMEDGFLRSVGLGAELNRPLSWVMDTRGIYYDATRPSDLEHLLQTSEFDPELCSRAAQIRHRIIKHGLTKYNIGDHYQQCNQPDADRLTGKVKCSTLQRVILVPGQVETDASIRFGATSIRHNIDLLKAVRSANPYAYIIYKPHPDVVSGLRPGGKRENTAYSFCDERVDNVSIHELLQKVDEVHVLTSLAGFEALLRNKPVTTYGQPFYAGWGLTIDLALTDAVKRRRTRKLSLDELVAGVLLLYPTYVSRTTGRFTTPERVLDELLEWRESSAHGLSFWRSALRLALRVWGVIR